MVRFRSSVLFLALFAICLPAFAESHSENQGNAIESDGAPPRRPPAPPGEIDAYKKILKDEPISPAWWQAAHRLLGEFLKKRETYEASVDAFAKELGDGSEKGRLFRALGQARVDDDGEKLRKTAYEGANPDKEASKQEILRRLTDPNTKLIESSFPRRPELAAIDAVKLVKAKSDAEAAAVVAKLMGMIKRPQREALKKRTDELLAQEGGPEKSGLDRKMVQRLNEAAKVSLGETPGTDFQKAFKGPYDQALADNREFWSLVPKAMAGDKAAKDEIVAKWGKEALLDVAADLAKNGFDGEATAMAAAIATDDGKGNLSLGLVAKNLGFGERDRNQILQLGNRANPEQISAALVAMHTANIADHSGGGTVSVANPLQAFEIDSNPPSTGARFFAAKGDPPKLTRRTEAGPAPSDQLAARPIRNPIVLEAPPAPTPTPTAAATGTPTVPPTGTPSSSSSDMARVLAQLNAAKGACLPCHGDTRFEIVGSKILLTNNKGTFDATQTQAGLRKVPMTGFLVGPFGEALRAWLELK